MNVDEILRFDVFPCELAEVHFVEDDRGGFGESEETDETGENGYGDENFDFS